MFLSNTVKIKNILILSHLKNLFNGFNTVHNKKNFPLMLFFLLVCYHPECLENDISCCIHLHFQAKNAISCGSIPYPI